MNQSHLFAGEGYYPRGGVSDYIRSFTFLEDAKEFIRDPACLEILHCNHGGYKCPLDWANIAMTTDTGALARVALWSYSDNRWLDYSQPKEC